jgi:hypothetical protein
MTFKVGDEIEFTSGYFSTAFPEQPVGKITKVGQPNDSPFYELTFTHQPPRGEDGSEYQLSCMKVTNLSSRSGEEFMVFDLKRYTGDGNSMMSDTELVGGNFILNQPVIDESKVGGKKIKSKKRIIKFKS